MCEEAVACTQTQTREYDGEDGVMTSTVVVTGGGDSGSTNRLMGVSRTTYTPGSHSPLMVCLLVGREFTGSQQ